MGTSVIGKLDSQVWKLLGIDIKDKNDANNNMDSQNEEKEEDRNKISTEEERLKRD